MLVASEVPGYDDAIAFLLGRIDYERVPPQRYRNREYKLDRMRELLSRLHEPQQRLKVVHIAGTKGKGSTAAMLASMATAAGLRVGAFTSPHLDRVEERIAINGQACSPAELVRLVQQIRPEVEVMDDVASRSSTTDSASRGPTYFELTTALAMLHFASQKVDLAILEVGMGGRLDSTNVCQPLCTAITSISYDHTRHLGDTLEKIAAEKAGIIKDRVPVVSGVKSPEAQNVIAATAAEHQAPLVQLDDDFDFSYHPPLCLTPQDGQGAGLEDSRGLATSRVHETESWRGTLDYRERKSAGGRSYSGVRLSLLGRHQAANAAVALAIAGVLEGQGFSFTESAIRQGLASAVCPARVELVHSRPAIVVDAAHNVASIAALLEVLDECFPAGPRTLVFASTLGKDLRGMLAGLVPKFDRIFFTRYRNNPRGVPADDLAALTDEIAPAAGSGTKQVTVCKDPQATWQAVRRVAPPDGLICVTGSFFIAAEMRQVIVGDADLPGSGQQVPGCKSQAASLEA
ncbi:MAG: bifunctional folylpolyglutamate synthase/dihydrofolate synthase [Planctomycetota bacterium]|nr:bifunctional folylpolyglutamate synthase/dihydrofolate synthase [Planctomycetota bacterium]